MRPTHVSLVFERVIAVVTPTVEMSGFLSEKGTGLEETVLGGAKSLKALLDDGRVLAVVVGVHLHVRSANVHLRTEW